jgi:hypothetical protein
MAGIQWRTYNGNHDEVVVGLESAASNGLDTGKSP